jgi:histone demethylase JARID1
MRFIAEQPSPGFHTFCLVPPLSTIPKGQWFCHSCLFGTGGDFGFDEGEDHTLATFQARDLAFRKMWFKSHPPPQPSSSSFSDADDPTVSVLDGVRVSEDDVENEFWRLVQSQSETVEIEYGADVHSTTHGRCVTPTRLFFSLGINGIITELLTFVSIPFRIASGMPTLETHPLNPYSRDPWNLNNMPILSDSLLRYIKSEISGMTVPWTYVGMIFSTFCWHNEVRRSDY